MWRRAALGLLVVSVTACEDKLDTTRNVPERGTLGEEIYGLLHKDLAREAPARADGFALERDRFILAVDHLAPEAELSDLQDLLVGLLPLYDDGTIPRTTRRLGGVLERLSQDQAALESLAALENRIGYIDLSRQEALFRRIAAYPQYRALAVKMIDFMLAHDGLDENGNPAPNEDDTITRGLQVVSQRIAEIEISQDDERTIVLAADLMLSEDVRMSARPTPLPDSPLVVARDLRGMAQVARINGLLPAPFVDDDNDGLADIDPQGRFLNEQRGAIALPPFATAGIRDERDRAITQGTGELVYEYVELDRTLISGVLRDGRTLMAREVPSKMVNVAEAMLGQRTAEGLYAAENSPMLSLTHAATSMLAPNDVINLLSLGRTLIENHEGSATYAVRQLEDQLDIADRHNVNLRANSTLFNDLMSIVRRLLNEPGMAEEIVEELMTNPDLLTFPTASAELMEYGDAPITAAAFDAGRALTQPVDRSRADTRDNQSLHQRVLHLIYDTRGVRYRPELLGVPLGFIFEIEDLGEFYMLSLIGEAEIPSLVSTLTGLSERPGPAELAHFINEDQLFGNAIGNEGEEVRFNDGDTLFAVSASGMDLALAPLVRIFHERGKLDLLFDAFEVLHLHYASEAGGDYQDASAQAPRYSKLSGIRNYEPMLIDIYRNTQIMQAARQLLNETANVRAPDGALARNVLIEMARRLMSKDPTLETIDGTYEVMIDGKRESPLSPFDLVRAAQSDIDGVVRRSATTQKNWDDIVDAIYEVFLETEATGPTSAQFVNSRVVPFMSGMLGFLEERAEAHRADGKLEKFIEQDIVAHVRDAITSEELPLALDMIHLIEEDPELESMMLEMRDQLMDEDDGFPEVLSLTGDFLGAAKDASVAVPFLEFLGRELAPEKKLAFDMGTFAKQAMSYDPDEKVLELARRGLERAQPDGIQLYGFTRAIKQANRMNPRYVGLVDGDDMKSVISMIGGYLTDDQHGLEKFYEIVGGRNDARVEASDSEEANAEEAE